MPSEVMEQFGIVPMLLFTRNFQATNSLDRVWALRGLVHEKCKETP